MKMVTIRMEDFLYDFYEKVGRQANLPPEQVMADALFKLAGEWSLHALHGAKKKAEKTTPAIPADGLHTQP